MPTPYSRLSIHLLCGPERQSVRVWKGRGLAALEDQSTEVRLERGQHFVIRLGLSHNNPLTHQAFLSRLPTKSINFANLIKGHTVAREQAAVNNKVAFFPFWG